MYAWIRRQNLFPALLAHVIAFGSALDVTNHEVNLAAPDGSLGVVCLAFCLRHSTIASALRKFGCNGGRHLANAAEATAIQLFLSSRLAEPHDRASLSSSRWEGRGARLKHLRHDGRWSWRLKGRTVKVFQVVAQGDFCQAQT
jgi:hypothetical protein